MALTKQEFQQLIDNQRAAGTLPVDTQKPKMPKPLMNKTEQRFAQWLDLQMRAGAVKEWWFEAIKLRVGHDCWWTPDFLIAYPDGRLELVDTKGTKRNKSAGATGPYAEEDAIVKARAIADKFPIPVFFAWREKNGEWLFKRM